MEFLSNTQYYEKSELSTNDLNVFFGGKEHHIVQNLEFGPYVHDYYDFHYCTKGSFDLYVNNRLFEIKEGMLFVIPPYARTSKLFTAKSTGSLYINIKGRMLRDYFSAMGLSEDNIVFSHTMPDNCARLLEEIIDLLSTHVEVNIEDISAPVIPDVVTCGSSADAVARRMRRRGLFQLLLSELMNICANEADDLPKLSQQKEYIDRAIKYIESNYNFDINVDEVAKHVGLNRSYLYTLFNDSLGVSVQGFIIQTRMRAACALLKHPDISIKSIAASVRYDPISFSRVFKKHFGISPTEYREKNTLS